MYDARSKYSTSDQWKSINANYEKKTGFSFVSCKSHCFKTANVKILSANSTHRSQLSHLSQRPVTRGAVSVIVLNFVAVGRAVASLTVFSGREFTFTFAICCRPSVCRLSVVCNVRAPYSGGSNFRQYFYGIRYLSYPLTSTENFTEIVPGQPLCRGS